VTATYAELVATAVQPRLLSRSLSAYLCGTRSGLLAARRGELLELESVAAGHRKLPAREGQKKVHLGERPWQPPEEARGLAVALRASLRRRPEVVDLVLFGSQARGETTGFSDVDAILVIEDRAAEDPMALRSLRRYVLAAQRAVIAHQPMQHHAFEVATPKLLLKAGESLRMPAVALSESRSLMGRAIGAEFDTEPSDRRSAHLSELVSVTTAASTWPRNPWRLHGLVSMFELLPTLYLQALGRPFPKWLSFAEARDHFGSAWWPYDVLRDVRGRWVRKAPPPFRATVSALRNPWIAVVASSRLPIPFGQPARRMLSRETLDALQELARKMGERAC
jgi:nucleotidyltransferase-like protein